MPQITPGNVVWLLVAIGAFWFFMRFVLGPKRGAPGLREMFRREKQVALEGMGVEAIKTLLEDTRAFVVAEPELRGLILAGSFAAKRANTKSAAILVVMADDPGHYSGEEWLPRWSYPGRGHTILSHHIEHRPGEVEHRFSLRGAPLLRLYFLRFDTPQVPASLSDAIAAGAETIEDPTGLTEKLRRHWRDPSKTRSGENT
ncbi:MAG: hypothetical protein LCH38_05090 [Proteobacteria bacterium]|nr:hypothetical protein [Pseudomonadota bacterium]